MGKPEQYVEYYLRDKCKEAGFICWKLTSPGTAGVPDRVIVTPEQTVYVETKAKGGKPRALQVKRLNDLRSLNAIACVIDTREKVDDFLDYLRGEKEIPPWYESSVPKNE